MQSVSPVDAELVPLANLLGVLYQVQDDYLNLQSDTYSKNKGFCEDITEGKFSFPILHSIRADPSNKEIISMSSFPSPPPSPPPSSPSTNTGYLDILKQRTTDVSLKEYAVSYMRDRTGSFEYAKQVVYTYERMSRETIKELNQKYDTSALEGILSKLLMI